MPIFFYKKLLTRTQNHVKITLHNYGCIKVCWLHTNNLGDKELSGYPLPFGSDYHDSR